MVPFSSPHLTTTLDYYTRVPHYSFGSDWQALYLGLINPNAKSPKSKASQTILGLLNPQQKQARRTTLDTTWMTNTSPNKALVVLKPF